MTQEVVNEVLDALRSLFSEIRNDWSDPRGWCREGWAIIDAARSGDWDKALELSRQVKEDEL